MLKLTLVAVAFSTLLTGCPHPVVIPDPRLPHEVAERAQVKVWCKDPQGTWVKCEVTAIPGWWLASPEIANGK